MEERPKGEARSGRKSSCLCILPEISRIAHQETKTRLLTKASNPDADPGAVAVLLEAAFAGVVPAAFRWPLDKAGQGPTAVAHALCDAWGAANFVAAVATVSSGAEDAQRVRHDTNLMRRLLCHLLRPLAFELLCGVNTPLHQLIAGQRASGTSILRSVGPCS